MTQATASTETASLVATLIAKHEELDGVITRALTGEHPHGPSSSPLPSLPEEPPLDGEPLDGEPGTCELHPAQAQGLAALQASLRLSLTLLREDGHLGVDADAKGLGMDAWEPLDRSVTPSWLPFSWVSNPPSPPGSRASRSTVGETERGGAAVVRGRSVYGADGRWSSGLLKCHYDPMSCCGVTCCWPIFVSQLGQKLIGAKYLCACSVAPMLLGSILMGSAFLWPMAVHNLLPTLADRMARVAGMDQITLPHFPANKFREETAGPSWCDLNPEQCDARTKAVASLIGSLFGFCLLYTWFLRILVRQRDRIPGSPLKDFCVTLCCFCCGVCQLARHEGLVKGQYGILSPTGEKRYAVVEPGSIEAV